MIDPGVAEVIPQMRDGIGGLEAVGMIVGGILTAILIARPLLSKLKVGAAMDGAQIDAIERLSRLLNDERALRRQAEDRADRFAQERNEAIQKIGKLEGEVHALRAEIASLRMMLERLNAAPPN